ncbi:hypothetical protein FZEAL_9264 [Fusarium zealandicum]|uniref:Methyltransferase n=1 Tax=Fusarium zealandicum TaxID=1053134 RepID=A0A8H4UC28_9HYPO|nr:hypothetical protein FZEAL_9264 [Fusarium zealandicum]
MSTPQTAEKPDADVPTGLSPSSQHETGQQDAPTDMTAASESERTTAGLLPGQYWTQQADEPDPAGEDDDSALGDNASSTASLSSTILQYREINGRRYHSERGNAQYWVSNDEQSNEALDINHHVLSLMYGGKLFKAPLDQNMQTVVDIGTGTGIWAIDFADEFPNTKVIGTDISPIQPTWVPSNLEFQIDDCTQEWTFPENSLDYVHMRFLVGSIQDWPALYKQAYRCLKPGGYIESYEGSPSFGSDDGSVHEKSAMGQWGRIFLEGGRKLGRPFSILEDDIQKRGMKEAGFSNLEEAEIKVMFLAQPLQLITVLKARADSIQQVPIGAWPKDPTLKQAGRFLQAAILQDVEGTLTFIANLLGWSEVEIRVFAAHYRREIKSKNIHGYSRQRVVWAQKPLEN